MAARLIWDQEAAGSNPVVPIVIRNRKLARGQTQKNARYIMNRTEMVNARADKLSKLSDKGLIYAILEYFRENATMPGEKAIKDHAAGLADMLEGNPGYGLTDSARKELIEEFSSLCVKEVKLKNVQVANETKKKLDYFHDQIEAGIMRKVSDLPMVLKDTSPIPVNAMKNIYEMPGDIFDSGHTVRIKEENGSDFVLASIPEGFVKNHRTLYGMDGTVIVTDYSNGKFANMSYTLLVDLGQTIQAVVAAA